MLKKILYLLHCETYEPELAQCLTRLQTVGCQEMLLTHVLRTEEVLHHVPTLLQNELHRCLLEAARQQLVTLAQQCQTKEFSVRPLLQEGAWAWLEVQRLVQEEAISLIVVGPFLGAHFGSTERLLLACTQVPLWIVKIPEPVAQGTQARMAQRLFGRVLYATDWSAEARQAQEYLVRLKPAGFDEVLVTHVIPPAEVAHRATLQPQLEHTQRELAAAGFSVRSVMLAGDPVHELVRLAQREEVALMVMGSTGAGKTTARTLGSVSAAVAQTTACSVLLA